MKQVFFLFISILFTATVSSQTLKGIIVDKQNNTPIIYANIGIVSSAFGCISDSNGHFNLHFSSKIDTSSIVRFSMMGYNDLQLSLHQAQRFDTIKLDKKDILLDEVVIARKNYSKKKKFGTLKKSKHGICGWGGTQFGNGHEIGLLIDLGEKASKIEKLHIRIYKHAFKKSILRLHIRDLKNGLPNNDLLTENVLIPIEKKSGWITIDLHQYKIFASGKIALTVEWISAENVINSRIKTVNKKKTPSILIYLNKKQGEIFIRKGSEMPWRAFEHQSPNMYIEVKQEA